MKFIKQVPNAGCGCVLCELIRVMAFVPRDESVEDVIKRLEKERWVLAWANDYAAEHPAFGLALQRTALNRLDHEALKVDGVVSISEVLNER